jgi:hypothetical protein
MDTALSMTYPIFPLNKELDMNTIGSKTKFRWYEFKKFRWQGQPKLTLGEAVKGDLKE